MKEIFEQYGGAIITVVAIMALVGITNALVGSGEQSVVYQAMSQMITKFTQSITV